MLRACVLTYGKNWEDSLPFAEFSYNNGHHTSLKEAPFEVLYERKCHTPLCGQKLETVSLKAQTLSKLLKKR
jgi:hypothetical protein